MNAVTAKSLSWVEQGLVPDRAIRHGIRRLLRSRLEELHPQDPEGQAAAEDAFVSMMDRSPIAPVPELANRQHYEVPPAFFRRVLGERKKYSCAYWPAGTERLDDAETAALELYCQRMGMMDGMRVLELGCGWGSLTLWLAERFPRSVIVGVTNSTAQKVFIEQQATRRGLGDVRIVRADMNTFGTDERFDRVVSIEMFEHMRNYRRLFGRIHGWLRPGGRFFMHIFCHRDVPYEFVDAGASDWMSRHFFSGGIMPSDPLPLRFQDHLKLVSRWRWNGCHYARTANAWLQNMDVRQAEIMPVLESVYGTGQAQVWWMRWRLFFMACAETFGHRDGNEWWVSHYLFERPAGPDQESA